MADRRHAITEVEKHYRKKFNPDAQDEIIEQKAEGIIPCKVEGIVTLISRVLKEKALVALAIQQAKNSTSWKDDAISPEMVFCVDSAIEYSKKLRFFAERLSNLCILKSTQYNKTGKGYKFNVEGNQVPYSYDIEVVASINFDRDFIIHEHKKAMHKADLLSKQVEEVLIKDLVRFEPSFDIYDSFESILTKFDNTSKG